MGLPGLFRKPILLAAVAVIMLVLLNLLILFGDRGLLELWRLQSERSALESKILQIENANRELMRLIKRLEEEDPELVEHIAKRQYKMLREGEISIIPPPRPEEKKNER